MRGPCGQLAPAARRGRVDLSEVTSQAFHLPVRAGSRVRGHYKLVNVTERSPKELLFKYEVTVEIEGQDKPALIAESLGMAVLQ